MRPNFRVRVLNNSRFASARLSFEGSVNMDLQENVDKDDYLRKEVSSSIKYYIIPWNSILLWMTWKFTSGPCSVDIKWKSPLLF